MTSDLIPYDYNDAITGFLEDIGIVQEVGNEKGTDEQKLRAIVSALGSLFSMQVPTIGNDPMQTLREIARDTKLANIARERAFYKLYLLTRRTKELETGVTVPMWYGITNDEEEVLGTQEDFIGWFTSKSGLGRASTFRRLRVYQRLEEFGIDGQSAWLKVLQMPNAMQELTSIIANWNRNQFTGADRQIALGIAEYVMPEQKPLLEQAFQDNQDTQTIKELYSPVVRAFINEVTTYQTAKSALEHVKVDILGSASVSYRWSPDEDTILATIIVPTIENGELVSESLREIAIFVDDPEPPDALMQDLFKRLPIRNRHELPGA